MSTTRPELVGTHGMVASTHWLASATGMAVLEDGGNAFDAATAAGFVLQVVEPHLNGPAGEVPALFATGGDPEPRALCGQGPAPAAATIEHYRDELGLELVPGTGPLAATVPGAWDGWLLLLRDHGTKTPHEVLRYALGYARHGFPATTSLSSALRAIQPLFERHWPSSASTWLPGGGVPPPGSRITNPALARTWERLLAEARAGGPSREGQIDAARRAWSRGFVAGAIDEFCRRPVPDGNGHVRPGTLAGPGLLTGEDLAGYAAHYERPVSTDVAGGWTLAKLDTWSQGPVLAQQLRLLERVRDELDYPSGVASARTVHLAVESAKLAFADREAWYGDSAEPAAAELLSAEYAARREQLLGERASRELRPGEPGGREPRLPEFVAQGRGAGGGDAGMGLGSAEPTVAPTGETRGDTVHVDVVDRWGDIISATPSGGWLQSSPTIPELGFCLGSRAQMFWLEEGLPNSLAPGKRPRLTLSPSLASRGGEPVLAFGTPGGDQQDQWQLCFWLAHTLGGLDLQAAIDAPAWHTTAFPSSFYPRTWRPGELVAESRLGPDTLAELRERGHDVVDAGAWALGRLSAVSRDPETGLLRAGANARGAQGYAAGR